MRGHRDGELRQYRGNHRDEDGTGRDHMERSAACEERIKAALAFAATPAGELKAAERRLAYLQLMHDDHGLANDAELAEARAKVTAMRAKIQTEKI